MVQRRRGSFAIISAFALLLLLGVAAITVDLGHARVMHTELQSAADAISHAAAMALSGDEEGMEAALAVAQEIAALNTIEGRTIGLDDPSGGVETTLSFGAWEDDGTFTESEDPEEVDAVRVVLALANSGTWFSGALVSQDALPVSARAIVVHPEGEAAGAVSCFVPLAIPSCLIEDEYDEETIQDVELKLNPPGVDNTGWARPNAHPNASWLRDQINDCESEGEVAVGDSLQLNNGVISSAMSTLIDAVDDSATTWDGDVWGSLPAQASKSGVSNYGNTFEGPIFLFDDDSFCASGGGTWNGSQTISGFAWAAVYDVENSGAASSRTIHMRLDTSRGHEVGTAGGGTSYGVTTPSSTIITQ